jgi:hypothetical protein
MLTEDQLMEYNTYVSNQLISLTSREALAMGQTLGINRPFLDMFPFN